MSPSDAPTAALFGFNFDSKRFFTQGVAPTGVIQPYELDSGFWTYGYGALALCGAGGTTYVFGCQAVSNGYWFLQEILPTGKLGRQTAGGISDAAWTRVCSYNMGGRCYLFLHRKGGSYYIHEITADGQLGTATASGQFAYYYATLCTVQVGGTVYLFGQRTNDNYWFLQELLPDGTLGPQTGGGTFKYFYTTVCGLTVGSRAFLFGQANDALKVGDFHFVQEVLPGGTLGETTEIGTWAYFYNVAAPIYTGGNTYMFAQGSARWFIAQLHPNGVFGPEISSGNWSYHYTFAGSFPTAPQVPPVS